MTIKLSTTKVERLLRLYLQGFTQVAIAGKIKVDQATVSLYVNELTVTVDEEGLETAAKEYGVMDIVKELHSLSAELKKSHLTVEDAKAGLKVAVAFEECGVPPDEYKDVVTTCLKMHNEGFSPAAVELHNIEDSSGMAYEEIVTHAATCQAQFQQTKKDLAATQNQVNQTKQTLAAIQQQKAGAEKDLQQFMHKVGVDYKRLEKVESLAMVLQKSRGRG